MSKAANPNAWIRSAKSDLKLATLATGSVDVEAAHIAFHYQQAAEKSLKALVARTDKDVPPDHDLDQLQSLLRRCGMMLPPDLHRIGRLNRYAVETCYATLVDPVSPEELYEAQLLAILAFEWAVSILEDDTRE